MTILNRKAIPFEVIFKEPIFLLFAVAEENEEVQAMREAGERVFVEFVGGVDTPYQRTEYKDNTTVRSLEDSFTADAVKISERQTL